MYRINSGELIEIRRDLHRNPELGGTENKTLDIICSCLESWNIEYERGVAETGVVAIVRGKNNAKSLCVGIRADIDALPIKEEANLDFKSMNEGIMHACGHDAHAAVALYTAKIMKSLESSLGCDVKFFFQPAEETTGGAERMIKEGCLKNPHVQYVFGLHVDPSLETGKISIKYGKMMASSDEVRIKVYGKSTHGAHPHNGIDPIVIASNLVMSLQSVVSRNVSPLNSVVLTMGSIHGGTGGNIIPDEVEMVGILRTLDPQTRDFMKKRIAEVVENIPKALGGEGKLHVRESYGALINDNEAVDFIKNTAVKVLGKENVVTLEYPNMGTEDFSYFCQNAKACFFNLGCRNENIGAVHPIHSNKFMLDEACLKIGVKVQVENILNVCDGKLY